MGLVLAVRHAEVQDRQEFLELLDAKSDYIASARPTAVNLTWALERLRNAAQSQPAASVAQLKQILLDQARAIRDEDAATCRAIGQHGLHLIEPGTSILTHCNAGSLATAEYGTALAPLYLAHKKGIDFTVYADETRPLLQGSRLTAGPDLALPPDFADRGPLQPLPLGRDHHLCGPRQPLLRGLRPGKRTPPRRVLLPPFPGGARHDADGLRHRPGGLLRRAGDHVPGPLRAGRNEAVLVPLGRGGPEILLRRSISLGVPALRHRIALGRGRQDGLLPARHPPPRRGEHLRLHRADLHLHRLRFQGGSGALPPLDPGRVPRRARTGLRPHGQRRQNRHVWSAVPLLLHLRCQLR